VHVGGCESWLVIVAFLPCVWGDRFRLTRVGGGAGGGEEKPAFARLSGLGEEARAKCLGKRAESLSGCFTWVRMQIAFVASKDWLRRGGDSEWS